MEPPTKKKRYSIYASEDVAPSEKVRGLESDSEKLDKMRSRVRGLQIAAKRYAIERRATFERTLQAVIKYQQIKDELTKLKCVTERQQGKPGKQDANADRTTRTEIPRLLVENRTQATAKGTPDNAFAGRSLLLNTIVEEFEHSQILKAHDSEVVDATDDIRKLTSQRGAEVLDKCICLPVNTPEESARVVNLKYSEDRYPCEFQRRCFRLQDVIATAIFDYSEVALRKLMDARVYRDFLFYYYSTTTKYDFVIARSGRSILVGILEDWSDHDFEDESSLIFDATHFQMTALLELQDETTWAFKMGFMRYYTGYTQETLPILIAAHLQDVMYGKAHLKSWKHTAYAFAARSDEEIVHAPLSTRRAKFDVVVRQDRVTPTTTNAICDSQINNKPLYSIHVKGQYHESSRHIIPVMHKRDMWNHLLPDGPPKNNDIYDGVLYTNEDPRFPSSAAPLCARTINLRVEETLSHARVNLLWMPNLVASILVHGQRNYMDQVLCVDRHECVIYTISFGKKSDYDFGIFRYGREVVMGFHTPLNKRLGSYDQMGDQHSLKSDDFMLALHFKLKSVNEWCLKHAFSHEKVDPVGEDFYVFAGFKGVDIVNLMTKSLFMLYTQGIIQRQGGRLHCWASGPPES